jgi:cytochrome c-type biogenesis protein
MTSVSISLAFLAGLLSFLSPCVLPLVPAYLSYLSGSSLAGNTPPDRRQVFGHALCFVGGFALIFVLLLGLPTTVISGALLQYSYWISRFGGVILILFGLHTIGLVTIPLLQATRRIEIKSGMQSSYLRSILVGMTFAAGWTPCTGVLLGTVMTMAFTEPSQAVVLLSGYALGLAIPFLAVAALLTQAVPWLKRVNQHMRTIKIASGLLMVAVGVLLVSGMYSTLNRLLIRITPEWLLDKI